MIGRVRGAAFLAADLGRHLVAVELGQLDVEQDEVGRLGAPQAESFGAVGRDDDVVPSCLRVYCSSRWTFASSSTTRILAAISPPRAWLERWVRGGPAGDPGAVMIRAVRARRPPGRHPRRGPPEGHPQEVRDAPLIVLPGHRMRGAVLGAGDGPVLGVRPGQRGQATAFGDRTVVSASPWMSSTAPARRAR